MSKRKSYLDRSLSISRKNKRKRARGLAGMMGSKRGKARYGLRYSDTMGFDMSKKPRRGWVGVFWNNFRERLSRTEYQEIKRQTDDAINNDPRLSQKVADERIIGNEGFIARLVRAVRDRVALIVKG